jgi:hypothetical protein
MTFIGGTFAGLMLDFADRGALGLSLAGVGLLWLIWTAVKLSNPLRHAHVYLPEESVDMKKLEDLEHDAIAEWYINETEKLVVVKYRKEELNEDELKAKLIHS